MEKIRYRRLTLKIFILGRFVSAFTAHEVNILDPAGRIKLTFPFSPAPGMSPKEGHKHNLCETAKKKKNLGKKKHKVNLILKIFIRHIFLFSQNIT